MCIFIFILFEFLLIILFFIVLGVHWECVWFSSSLLWSNFLIFRFISNVTNCFRCVFIYSHHKLVIISLDQVKWSPCFRDETVLQPELSHQRLDDLLLKHEHRNIVTDFYVSLLFSIFLCVRDVKNCDMQQKEQRGIIVSGNIGGLLTDLPTFKKPAHKCYFNV